MELFWKNRSASGESALSCGNAVVQAASNGSGPRRFSGTKNYIHVRPSETIRVGIFIRL
jgi:hypothetical protein